MSNYEGMQKITQAGSAQKGSESYESQKTTKSLIVPFLDVIAGKRM